MFESYCKFAGNELPEKIRVLSNPVEQKRCGDYTLIVVSREDNDWKEPFKAMYLKRTLKGYSTVKPLIEAGGSTIENALGSLWFAFAKLQLSGQIEGNIYYKHYYNEETENNKL